MKNEKKAIDLGLPSGTLWATCNVGANSPEDYGDYYAWGETKTKSEEYTWRTYKFNLTDGLTTLEAADDAATANWGSEWRTPTADEWKELIDNCTWTSITKNGVNGYEVKGKNSNSIFLPAAGCRFEKDLLNAGSYGVYWSSSLDTEKPKYSKYGCFGGFYKQEINVFSSGREIGRSVRPVCK